MPYPWKEPRRKKNYLLDTANQKRADAKKLEKEKIELEKKIDETETTLTMMMQINLSAGLLQDFQFCLLNGLFYPFSIYPKIKKKDKNVI